MEQVLEAARVMFSAGFSLGAVCGALAVWVWERRQ